MGKSEPGLPGGMRPHRQDPAGRCSRSLWPGMRECRGSRGLARAGWEQSSPEGRSSPRYPQGCPPPPHAKLLNCPPGFEQPKGISLSFGTYSDESEPIFSSWLIFQISNTVSNIKYRYQSIQFSSVQLLSHVQLFATP